MKKIALTWQKCLLGANERASMASAGKRRRRGGKNEKEKGKRR